MDKLLHKLNTTVNGVITGFDRIVFKGILMPIIFALGMQGFLTRQNVLNKNFKAYATSQSQAIVTAAEEISIKQCGCPSSYISSSNTRKETLAHKRQEENNITEGLIGVWSCVESCQTFRSTFNPSEKYPILKSHQSRCKHLYFYFDDPTYGFMSIRLQTWAPYEIQVALNGREWLRRSLDSAKCGYVLHGNKFLHIDDYALAQKLLDTQLNHDFHGMLNGLLPSIFPDMMKIVPDISYYWTLWQSEVAKDYIFESPDALNPLMDDFMRYALITGTGDRILRYFGNPINVNAQPHPNANPEILSRAKFWYDGLRVRHWKDGNSVKFYNEHNVLRFETTINDPTKFKIHRHSQNQDKSEPKKLLPMRKGIADICVRAQVSCNIVNRFSDHVASAKMDAKFGTLLDSVSKPLVRGSKKIRALDVFGKDLMLLQAIADPSFDASAITNKNLKLILNGTSWSKNLADKNLSARISRHLFLLREHGIIKKLPNQRKYILTENGRNITSALNVARASSLNDLLALSA